MLDHKTAVGIIADRHCAPGDASGVGARLEIEPNLVVLDAERARDHPLALHAERLVEIFVDRHGTVRVDGRARRDGELLIMDVAVSLSERVRRGDVAEVMRQARGRRVEPRLRDRGQLTHRHLETTVTNNHPDLGVRSSELGTNGGRQSMAREIPDKHLDTAIGAGAGEQDVTIENGPTGVIPGTQYFEARPEEEDRHGIPMTGTAGSVIVIHFDLWHRAFPNMTPDTRYMMKFQFTRMSEPSTPQWQNPGSTLPLNGDSDDPRSPMWSNIWDWLSGQPDPSQAEHNDIGKLSDELLGDNEKTRLHAAYTLSTLGQAGVPALMHGLRNEIDDIKRDACYGLGPAGAPAIPELVHALKDDSETVRGYATYALGDMGIIAAETVPELTKLVDDPSEWVRRNLSEALGNIAQKPEKTVPALIRLMDDEDGQVRFNTAYSIGKFGEGGQDAVPALKKGDGATGRRP